MVSMLDHWEGRGSQTKKVCVSVCVHVCVHVFDGSRDQLEHARFGDPK